MATITGQNGVVKFGTDASETELTEAYEWSLDTKCDVHDMTTFSSSGVTAKTYVAGLKDFTATVNAYAEDEAPQTLGTKASLLLYTDGTDYWDTGGATALLSAVSTGVPIDGKATVVYTFVGGAITHTAGS